MPSFTTPRDWTDGEVPTAAMFNVDVRDNQKFLRDWSGEIAYTERLFDSDEFRGTETTLLQLAATIPAGARNLQVTTMTFISGTLAGDKVLVRLKMDGNTKMSAVEKVGTGINPPLNPILLVRRFAAPAAGEVVFKLTAERVSGTGSLICRSTDNWKTYILVEGL